MTDTPSDHVLEQGQSGAGRPSAHDKLVTAGVGIVGLAVIAFLTHYNLTGYSVWAAGTKAGWRSWDEYILVNVAGLILPPFLLLFGVLRTDPAEFGLRAPDRGAAKVALAFFALMLPVLVIVSRRPEFYFKYPLVPAAANQWSALLAYELIYGFYFLCWEWFYRGFLTFGLSRSLGAAPAIILQAVGFGIMHYGKPTPEFISSFVGGAILGWMALRYRSFWPCFLLHWAISGTLDVLAIHARPGGLF